MSGMMRILAVAGASGGHIFPAVAFLDSLRNRCACCAQGAKQQKDIEVLLVLPKRSLQANIIPSRHPVKFISTLNIGAGINFKNGIALFKFLQGTLESLLIFLAFKPDIVVGFGGLDSVPLVLIAWMARVKTVIHEQNCIPGRANRLLAKFSDKIAISFSQTRDHLRVDKSRIMETGNPIRQELRNTDKNKALRFFGFQDNKITLLAMGGSRGSRKINTCFLDTLASMPEASKLQIIHIAGNEDFQRLDSGYKELSLNVKLFRFLEEMHHAYSICDLAICRAGATTIAELIFFRIPALIIPYPFAYEHQLSNARILEDYRCAVLIKDEDLGAGLLKRSLEELINKPAGIQAMRENYSQFSGFGAHDLLAEWVSSDG